MSAHTKDESTHIENSSMHPPSIMQAERVRIAAEMNLRKEAHSRSPSLRRKLLHIRVLASLEEMHLDEDTPSPPPSYHEAVEFFDEPEEIKNTNSDFGKSHWELDSIPEVESDEEDDVSDHEWSSDEDPLSGDESEDESEDGHALIRIVSHPSDDRAMDAQHWAELVSETTGKQGSDSPVTASVVEVQDDDD